MLHSLRALYDSVEVRELVLVFGSSPSSAGELYVSDRVSLPSVSLTCFQHIDMNCLASDETMESSDKVEMV